jgi:hypothetical protein
MTIHHPVRSSGSYKNYPARRNYTTDNQTPTQKLENKIERIKNNPKLAKLSSTYDNMQKEFAASQESAQLKKDLRKIIPKQTTQIFHDDAISAIDDDEIPSDKIDDLLKRADENHKRSVYG